MSDIIILRAKPNPYGKDRYGFHATQELLRAEWIDLYNNTNHGLNMDGVSLYDHTFGTTCGDQGKRLIFRFGVFTLPSGSVVRIHSGESIESSKLPPEDSNGADYHGYTTYNYVLNNLCGDIIEVRNKEDVLVDKTSYSPKPAEGDILERKGNLLI